MGNRNKTRTMENKKQVSKKHLQEIIEEGEEKIKKILLELNDKAGYPIVVNEAGDCEIGVRDVSIDLRTTNMYPYFNLVIGSFNNIEFID